ncbi:MAG: efflux RND transporter permease subunit, partial [Holophagales bacterium]|nr:efflux RND transporter permease subunit [Holophagales bacterium]
TPRGGFDGDIRTLGEMAEELIEPRFERVPGVAQASVIGARQRELRVWVDPARLATRGLSMAVLVEALRRENRDWSAGDLDAGKRRYVVRSTGAFRDPEELAELAIPAGEGPPVRLGDVAEIEVGHAELREAGFYLGHPTVGVAIQKKAGANVLQVMAELRRVAAEIDRELLAEKGLRLEQSYDETEYIDRAIHLVRQSLLLGGVLAIVVLYLFLRSRAITWIVAVSIPLSIIGGAFILWASGRSLNVISLAGLAFAVGMVVDNSIVVMENIFRHRQMGKSRRRSAIEGARDVWGAILASTLTTIAVFLPIVFVPGEVGQLFRDLALAIAGAVAWSLIVALTLIPSLSAHLLERMERSPKEDREGRLPEGLGGAGRDGGWGKLADSISHRVYRLCGRPGPRVAAVVGSTVAALGLAWWLAPDPEYLPTGNRNFVFGIIQPPPGYNVAEVAAFQEPFVQMLEPWATPPEGRSGQLPGGGVRSFYFVATPTAAVLGVRAREPGRARELLAQIDGASSRLPGARVFVTQRSVFENTFAAGRNIDIDLTGPELDTLLGLGERVLDRVDATFPGSQARTVPGLHLANEEIRLQPHRRRLAELGLTGEDLGLTAASSVDGAWVGRYLHDGREIDLRVRSVASREGVPLRLETVPLATPAGQLVTLGSVASIERGKGPQEIRRLDRQRTLTVTLLPPPDLALGTAMDRLEEAVLEPLEQAGALGGAYRARLSGSAGQLLEAARSLRWIFLLAVVLLFLLMAGLFESFVYPLVVLWVLPLATFGGFLGLSVLRLFVPQGLDMLTMLGFMILLGTVVNNAILLVYQSLSHRRDDEMSARDAVTAAARNRARPIFMSVATSVFGMLPLVLVPGAGSELYRGLGSVVIGGLLVSTLLTLLLVPALLSLVLEGWEGLLGGLRQRVSYRSEESSRYDLFSPPESGSVARLDPSGTVDL